MLKRFSATCSNVFLCSKQAITRGCVCVHYDVCRFIVALSCNTTCDDDEVCLNSFVPLPPTSVILLTNGTLLITQVKPRNTGTYRCVGRGLRGSHVTLEASLLIAGMQPHTQDGHWNDAFLTSNCNLTLTLTVLDPLNFPNVWTPYVWKSDWLSQSWIYKYALKDVQMCGCWSLET